MGQEIHGRPPGSIMTVEFDLDGQPFTALNGGPMFTFSEAISLQVFAGTQDELDYYWNRLIDGGAPQPCGWLKDRFGLSWQVVPTNMDDMLDDPSARTFRASAGCLQPLAARRDNGRHGCASAAEPEHPA